VSSTQVALVTGGGSGIGRAASLAFARKGAAVTVGDRSREGGLETVKRIEAAGGTGIFVELDVTDPASVTDAFGVIEHDLGGLRWAFNSAGVVGPLVDTGELEEDAWAATLAVNLTGTWRCMRHELSLMLRGGGGAIVNAASNFGLVGGPKMAAYVASKHGVLGLTKVAALEYARRNIRINAVCPGAIDTPMTSGVVEQDPAVGREVLDEIERSHPVGRLGTAPEVADAVLWLCSDEASFVTGAVLAVDGGYTAR
jgi:NAD(P)-dependent dehydrogenase (short-subunit alcohol dehydrogenase family)